MSLKDFRRPTFFKGRRTLKKLLETTSHLKNCYVCKIVWSFLTERDCLQLKDYWRLLNNSRVYIINQSRRITLFFFLPLSEWNFSEFKAQGNLKLIKKLLFEVDLFVDFCRIIFLPQIANCSFLWQKKFSRCHLLQPQKCGFQSICRPFEEESDFFLPSEWFFLSFSTETT